MIHEQDLGQGNVDWIDREKALAEFGAPDQENAKSDESKGDASGHPFHGNRFTGGIGGSGLKPATPRWTVEQRGALMDYQGNVADSVNEYLRNPASQSVTGNAFLDTLIERIDSTMETLPSGKTVYRGIASLGVEAIIGQETGSFGEKIGAQELHDKLAALVGSTIEDKGFCSTTTDPGVAAGKVNHFGVLCEIDVPKGYKAVGTLPDPAFKYEKELLLERGTAFKVVGVSDQPRGDLPTEFPTFVLHLQVAA